MRGPTPSASSDLTFQVGGFATLSEGLDYAARGRPVATSFRPGASSSIALPTASCASGRETWRSASEAWGCPGAPGSRRCRHHARLPGLFFGCQYAGLVPVPLPLSVNFGGRAAYDERLAGMIQTPRAGSRSRRRS